MQMGRTWIGAGLAGGFLLAAAAGAVAEDAAVLPPAALGVTQVLTAAELAAWGRDRNDPGALIMAARLMAEVPLRQAGGDSDDDAPS